MVVVVIRGGIGPATFAGGRGVGRTGLPFVIQDLVLPARKVLRVPFAWTTSSLVALSSCRGISQLTRRGDTRRIRGKGVSQTCKPNQQLFEVESWNEKGEGRRGRERRKQAEWGFLLPLDASPKTRLLTPVSEGERKVRCTLDEATLGYNRGNRYWSEANQVELDACSAGEGGGMKK